MPRKREIHPSLWENEEFFKLDAATRLVWIGLWSICDRNGCFEWRPGKWCLKFAAGLPCDPSQVESNLLATGFIEAYEVDGKAYGFCLQWQKFQSPHPKESPQFPVPQSPNFNRKACKQVASKLQAPGKQPEDPAHSLTLLPSLKETTTPLPPKGERGVGRIAPYLELWNAKLVPLGYGRADRATKKRRDGLTARLKDNPDFLETFTKAVDYLSRDAWWLGKASQFTVDLLLCQVNRAQELSEKTPGGPKTNSPSHRSRVDAEYIESHKTAKQRKEVPDVQLSEEDEKLWEVFR